MSARELSWMKARIWRLLACLLWLALAALPGVALASEIAIVLSKRGEAQTAFLDALRRELATTPSAHLNDAGTVGESIDEGMIGRADLVITVGAEATGFLAARPAPPILAVLISSHNLSALQGKHPKARLGGIVLDQPLSRHFRLIRAALPNAVRIGVLLGPQSAPERPALQEAAAREGLKLQIEQINDADGLIRALEELLESNDAILAVPDSIAFSTTTARPILLTTYRYRKPLFGYSQAYVTAGALAAVFSSPADVARQVVEWLQRAGGRFDPPPAESPRTLTVAVNRHVSRALGIPLADESMLAGQIDKRRQP